MPMTSTITPTFASPLPIWYSRTSARRFGTLLAHLGLALGAHGQAAAVARQAFTFPRASPGHAVPPDSIAFEILDDVAALDFERQGGGGRNPVGATAVGRLQLRCRCRTLLGGRLRGC